MKDLVGRSGRGRHQDRIAKVVWGLLFVVMGVLFLLDEMGRIDMSRGGSREFAADYAVDGSDKTRWASAFRDPQWIVVDLGAPADIRKVRLNWEKAYARDYEVQASPDGAHWTTLTHVTGGDGGFDEHEVSGNARYVRVNTYKRATPWGYSLWELEIYGPEGHLLSQGKTASASSLEGFGPWPLYWPLLLVAAGLPLVIAPRDGGNQVIGLVMTAVGTYWQLRNLDLVSWGVREAAAVLLIGAGLLILLQSLRDPGPADAKPDGEAGSAEGLR